MSRILIVSDNEVLMRNIYEWFNTKIDDGDIVIDHAKSREEAETLLEGNTYEKIFHNGIYIIDAVERLQTGSEVFHYGGGFNNKFNNIDINPHDKKTFLKIFTKKYFQVGVNIGGYLLTIASLAGLVISAIAFSVMLRDDVDENMGHIVAIEKKIGSVQVAVDDNSKNVDKLVTIFGIVYGEKVLSVINDSDKSSKLGDNND